MKTAICTTIIALALATSAMAEPGRYEEASKRAAEKMFITNNPPTRLIASLFPLSEEDKAKLFENPSRPHVWREGNFYYHSDGKDVWQVVLDSKLEAAVQSGCTTRNSGIYFNNVMPSGN